MGTHVSHQNMTWGATYYNLKTQVFIQACGDFKTWLYNFKFKFEVWSLFVTYTILQV